MIKKTLAFLLTAGLLLSSCTAESQESESSAAVDGEQSIAAESGNLVLDGYRDMTITEFNAAITANPQHLEQALAKYTQVYENPSDEFIIPSEFEYSLSYFLAEQKAAKSHYLPAAFLNYSTAEFYFTYDLFWEIENQDQITVGEREDAFNLCKTAVEEVFEELRAIDIQPLLDEIAAKHSIPTMKIVIAFGYCEENIEESSEA